jgi:hypothetical protein
VPVPICTNREKPANGRFKERRNVFADVHELAMRRVDAPDIGFPWTSADMLRRSWPET